MKNFFINYARMADMLGESLGKDFEIVIYDLSELDNAVVYVVNNKITGVKEGDSCNAFIKELMEQEAETPVVNIFQKANGKDIRTSAQLLWDKKGKLRGAFVVNADTFWAKLQVDYWKQFLPGNNADIKQSKDVEENIQNGDVMALLNELVNQVMGDAVPEALSREARIEKIRQMEAKGVFLVKGSIELVAEHLKVNKVTVYSYLDVVHGKRS